MGIVSTCGEILINDNINSWSPHGRNSSLRGNATESASSFYMALKECVWSGNIKIRDQRILDMREEETETISWYIAVLLGTETTFLMAEWLSLGASQYTARKNNGPIIYWLKLISKTLCKRISLSSASHRHCTSIWLLEKPNKCDKLFQL